MKADKCPDPEFKDFEKDRKQECFTAGQIWAVYYAKDAMLRTYAYILKVISPGFNLHIAWLKPVPENDNETKWVDKGLPVSCGMFGFGKFDTTEDLSMFSHLVSWEIKKGMFVIVPRKGETWAIFRDWSRTWSHNDTRRCEYEIVEILSDYYEDLGVWVSYLEKVNGFRFFFSRKKGDGGTVIIPACDKYRLSHMVPSCRMTGEEREGVPAGCFEVDVAGLPASAFIVQLSACPKRNVSYKENVNDNDHDHDDEAAPSKKRAPPSGPAKPTPEDTFWKTEVREPVKESQNQESQFNSEATNGYIEDLESEPESEWELFECPESEFINFEKDRKEDSFAPGQIWAVYDTEDAMPRFYALIRKVLSPGFNLQITWLKPVPETDDETNWVDVELPVSCGKFKHGKHYKAKDLPMFSHLVTWEEGKKGIFNIIPRKGETWALFKGWSINWSNDGTGKYEYEFVEVLSDYDEGIGFRVSYLEKLAGFRCLFGRKKDREMVIPESDKYRFSHMVPSCRMSGEEREGVPKGCYELDPAGLPASAFE